jgi:hypothetical protein
MVPTEPRLLLVPVSGPLGIGEFARSLAIGNAVKARWPQVELRFVIHRDAPYAASLTHQARLLPASPTLCTREVIEEIATFRPRVVYFDNAGRTRQLRAAGAAGARTVYVSSRGRQRYKAFRLRWMSALDEHWISYSPLLAGGLGPLEQLKLRLLGRPQVRFLDAVLAPADAAGAAAMLGAGPPPDVVIVPGGGSAFPDARVTPAMFAGWGRQLAELGWNVLMVAGPSFRSPFESGGRLRVVRQVDGGVLMALLAKTRLVLVNGGDTLVQALALHVPCVAVPIALDQAERIRRCAALGAVVAPSVDEVAAVCHELLSDEARLTAQRAHVRGLGFRDAMPGIVGTLGRMLGLEPEADPASAS